MILHDQVIGNRRNNASSNSSTALQAVNNHDADDEESLHLHPLLDDVNKTAVERVMGDELPLTQQSPLYAEVQHILQRESNTVSYTALLTVTALFVWLVFTDAMKDLVKCGSVVFWLLVLSIVPVVGGLIPVVRRQLIHKDDVKKEVRSLPPFLIKFQFCFLVIAADVAM
jgi:hypothetical protein